MADYDSTVPVMQFDPEYSESLRRLRESMRQAESKIRPFVTQFLQAQRMYAGDRYGDNTDVQQTTVNLFKLAVDTWMRRLVTSTPQVLVLTTDLMLRPDAHELKVATDRELEDMEFGSTLSECIQCALFGMGIMKVGITSPWKEESGYRWQTGMPFAEPVLLDDFIFDMTAKRKEAIGWMANRYRVPLDIIKSSPEFQNTEDLTAATVGGESNIYRGSERANYLSTGDGIAQEEFVDHVELWDVWLQREKMLVTFAVESEDYDNPLRVIEWDGPPHGPFHLLSFSKVPGNVLPAPPAQQLYHSQDLFHRLFNKLGDQSERAKKNTVVDEVAINDGTADRLTSAGDGETVRAGSVDSVREHQQGGPMPEVLQFVSYLREMFSYSAGNLDAMAGLQSQAETATQEELLVEGSNIMLKDFSRIVVEFGTKVVTDVSWWMYSDPSRQMDLSKHVEGYGDIPFTYGPQQRTVSYDQFQLRVLPYSLKEKGPTERVGMMLQFLQQVAIPLGQLQPGSFMLDIPEILRIFAEYNDMPELNRIIVLPSGMSLLQQPGQQQGGGGQVSSPAHTSREYVRTNRTASPLVTSSADMAPPTMNQEPQASA